MSFLYNIKVLKYFKILWIDGVCVFDFFFLILSFSCRFLIDIGVSKCVGVMDIGIIGLVCNCINLKILNLACCGFVIDVVIFVVV